MEEQSPQDESAERRAKNRTASAALLKEHGVPYTTNNAGVHLMIQHGKVRIDFWPGTGLWSYGNGANRRNRRGIFPLLKFLGKDVPDATGEQA